MWPDLSECHCSVKSKHILCFRAAAHNMLWSFLSTKCVKGYPEFERMGHFMLRSKYQLPAWSKTLIRDFPTTVSFVFFYQRFSDMDSGYNGEQGAGHLSDDLENNLWEFCRKSPGFHFRGLILLNSIENLSTTLTPPCFGDLRLRYFSHFHFTVICRQGAKAQFIYVVSNLRDLQILQKFQIRKSWLQKIWVTSFQAK